MYNQHIMEQHIVDLQAVEKSIKKFVHEKATKKVTKEATCTEAEEKQTACDTCSEVVKSEEIPALGHDQGEWITLPDGTMRQLKCTRCGTVLEEEKLNVKQADWRYNQTVSSMGIRYRDIKPGLTSKWYMFTPLDLSKDGVTELDLVAANASKVGTITVTVQDGKATVVYSVRGGVEESDMGFALLPDLASVTDVEAIDYTQFAFGQEISVEDDLGGDTRVLLQVMGRVNYDFNDPRCVRFYNDNKEYHALVDSLKLIME